MNDNNPTLFFVDKEYLKYMHKIDYRVSVKYNNRVFVGIITVIGSQKYVIPLTSQTTEARKREGKRKRSSLITTFVTESNGTEIANILYNNMIPVYDEVITPVTVNPEVDTYISNEIRFIRKTWEVIQNKALYVYDERYLTSSKNYSFLVNTCCDFKKLEAACQQYQVSTDN